MRRLRFKLTFLAGLLAAGLLVAACAPEEGGGEANVQVVATTTQIGAIVRELAGDRVGLTVLLQAGADAHDYEPSPQDSRRLVEAELVLKNGIGLDDWLDDLIKNSGTTAKVVTVSEGIEPIMPEEDKHADDKHADDKHADEKKDEHGHDYSKGDPHIWHDPENVKVMARNIAEALATVDPENAATYRENAAAYMAKMDDVDRQIRAMIDPIPEANRKIVTNHKAFGYFFRRYDLKLVGAIFPGVAKDAQPSAKDLAELTDLIREERVKAIFAEVEIDPKVAEQLAKDTGVRIVTGLYADSLGPPGSGAETVEGMLLHNARLISEALR
jgi:ABC-type Zn uptake system ZnuABC Zn-binding protein ZnuA